VNRTKIEWTSWSWNPITGCEHGCWYCYARKLAQRFPKNFPNGFKPTFHPERLKEPWDLKKPSKIFVCSISDLFAPWTPPAWTDAVLESIRNCPIPHKFQLLTKSPEGIPTDYYFGPNVWIGVTITTQAEMNKIFPLFQGFPLFKVKCGIHFASFEPLLGPISTLPAYFEWIIIGKLTGSRRVKLQAQWVDDLLKLAEDSKIPVFMKNNLKPDYPGKLIQEFPEVKAE